MMVTIMAPFFLIKLGCIGERTQKKLFGKFRKEVFFSSKQITVHSALQGHLKKLNDKIKSYKL